MGKNISSLIIIFLVLVIGAGLLYFSNGATPENNKINFVAGRIVGSIKSPTLGEYLTDTKGMTLYTYALDGNLESKCTGGCLKEWPIFEDDNKTVSPPEDVLSQRINVFTRIDGKYQQYAYGTKPLYYYSGDKNPGDVNGNKLHAFEIVKVTR